MILNPIINEKNIIDLFNLQHKDCYLDSYGSVTERGGCSWSHILHAHKAFKSRGTQWRDELPDYSVAYDCMKKVVPDYEDFFSDKFFDNELRDFSDKEKEDFLTNWQEGDKLYYPIIGGYSDIVIVRKKYLKEFCRYCGVMAAMNLFVEIAVPTAMALCTSDIQNFVGANLQVIKCWDSKEKQCMENEFFSDVNSFWEKNKDVMYVHPIKLSRFSGLQQ